MFNVLLLGGPGQRSKYSEGNPNGDVIFPSRPDCPWGPTMLLVKWTPRLIPAGNAVGPWRLPPSSI
jgi:hypothetical protein